MATKLTIATSSAEDLFARFLSKGKKRRRWTKAEFGRAARAGRLVGNRSPEPVRPIMCETTARAAV